MRSGFVFAIMFLWGGLAHAQYKNSSFGIDAGYWLSNKPNIINESNPTELLNPNRRPLRLSSGLRFGGEANYKLDTDRLWVTGRVNLAFLRFGSSASSAPLVQQFDDAASDSLGTIFGLQGLLGLRYFILTDYVKPYIQGGLSFMRLFTFSSASEDICQDMALCNGVGTNRTNFLPAQNLFGLHVQPGVEIIVDRDLAITFYADVERWVIINADDNTTVTFAAGVVIYD